jgi:dienelactone hydrolase
MTMRLALITAFAYALAGCTTPFAPPSNQAAPRASMNTSARLPFGVAVKEATWYSEQVRVSGRLFLPAKFDATSAAAGIVLAPGWGKTAETLDVYAAELAGQGLVALAIDYRGWGRSAGEIYLGERVDTYDKMRFSEQTPELVIRRGRLDPEHQIQDIRNAITYLQGEAGIDRSKIGVVGLDMAGGHVVSVLGMDARAKAGVAVTPKIPGQGEERKSYIPDAKTQAELIQLARNGSPPKNAEDARSRNAQEARLALDDYKPFWRAVAIPPADAVRFIIAEQDKDVDNATNAAAVAATLKGPHDIQTLTGAGHNLNGVQTIDAARLAADWLKAQLGK